MDLVVARLVRPSLLRHILVQLLTFFFLQKRKAACHRWSAGSDETKISKCWQMSRVPVFLFLRFHQRDLNIRRLLDQTFSGVLSFLPFCITHFRSVNKEWSSCIPFWPASATISGIISVYHLYIITYDYSTIHLPGVKKALWHYHFCTWEKNYNLETNQGKNEKNSQYIYSLFTI